MSRERSRCAPPDQETSDWDRIPWDECHRRVRRLQERIVKATREGRWGKVKSLQWLLTHSFYGKALAVKRRHRHQSLRWLAKRYWHVIGSRNWTFAVHLDEGMIRGKPDWLRLVYATDTRICRHLKIRAKANPFDSEWARYFEERADLKRNRSVTRKSGKSVGNTGSAHAGL